LELPDCASGRSGVNHIGTGYVYTGQKGVKELIMSQDLLQLGGSLQSRYIEPLATEQNPRDQPYQKMMNLFEEMSLLERAKRTLDGLAQSKDSGAYKFARLQLQRLSAPFLALILPLFLVALLMVFGGQEQMAARGIASEVIVPDMMEDLEAPPEPPEQNFVIDMANLDVHENVTQSIQVEHMVNEPMSPQPADFNSVTIVKSPIVMRGILGSARNAGARGQAISAHGGDARTEEAVLRALRWLKGEQKPDGSWVGNLAISGSNGKPDTTGFVLLAFLSHGETPESEEFGETVKRALDFLMLQADPGVVGTYALIEAYGLTMHPSVKDSAIKGLQKWVQKVNKADNIDSLIGVFMSMALHASKLGNFDFEGIDSMIIKLEDSFRQRGSRVGTSGRGTWHITFCAVGLQYLGKHEDSVVGKTVDILRSYWPPATLDQMDLACCPVRANYFVTMMYFNMGGRIWSDWNRTMKEVYVRGQKIEQGKYVDHQGKPREVGFWTYDDSAGGVEHAGTQPLISTCYIVQQLMVYYRYLPTWQKELVAEASVVEDRTDKGDLTVDIVM